MEEQKKTKEKTGKKELIYEKIPAIMADVQTIGKDRKNVQQKYSFRGIDDVYKRQIFAELITSRNFGSESGEETGSLKLK